MVLQSQKLEKKKHSLITSDLLLKNFHDWLVFFPLPIFCCQWYLWCECFIINRRQVHHNHTHPDSDIMLHDTVHGSYMLQVKLKKASSWFRGFSAEEDLAETAEVTFGFYNNDNKKNTSFANRCRILLEHSSLQFMFTWISKLV